MDFHAPSVRVIAPWCHFQARCGRADWGWLRPRVRDDMECLMKTLGYSTGALAFSDFRKALVMLKDQPVCAVELSAIREQELIPLLRSLDELDLSRFEYVSIHAPSQFPAESEGWIFQELYDVRHRGWPIVVHPDTFHDFSLWRQLGDLLCIENMDQRKPVGRTARELEDLFVTFPDASFCFDIGHARQVDT